MDARELLERYEAGERSFARARLKGAELPKAELTGADLSRADLAGASLGAAELEGAKLVGADLSGADLRDANLAATDLQNANLRGTRLQYADLREAMGGHAFLQHADFQHADLRGVDFRDAELQHADLRHAQLQYADLRGANLTNADLRSADLRTTRLGDATLLGAIIDAETLRASQWTPDQLSAVIALGADIRELQELSTDMRRVVTGVNRGLTLYFDAPLNALDDLTIRAVVVAVLGPDTDCRGVEYDVLGTGCLLRFEAGDDADLRALADALADRVWENKVREEQATRQSLSELLPGADRTALSLLIDRSNRYELYRAPTEGDRPVLDQKWDLGITPEARLATLLPATLGVADLRRWLAKGPLGPELAAGLPGVEASARAFGRAAATALAARDQVNRELFVHLVEAQPAMRRAIAFVAGVWDIELPPPPARDKYDFESG